MRNVSAEAAVKPWLAGTPLLRGLRDVRRVFCRQPRTAKCVSLRHKAASSRVHAKDSPYYTHQERRADA